MVGALTTAGAQFIGWMGLLTWGWIIAVRAVAVCTGATGRKLLASGGVIAGLMAFSLFILPRAELWVSPLQGAVQSPLATESAFHAQGELIGRQLDAVEPGIPGTPELFFVGFAPDGSQDVFLREMRSVKSIVEREFDAAPPLDRADQQRRHRGAIPDRHGHQPAPHARQDRRADEPRRGRPAALRDRPRRPGLRPVGACAAARARAAQPDRARARAKRRRDQVAGAGDFGLLLGRVHRAAQGRQHADHHRRRSRSPVVRLRDRQRMDLFRRGLFREGAAADQVVHRSVYRWPRRPSASARVAEKLSPPSNPQMFAGRAIAEKLRNLRTAPKALPPTSQAAPATP